MTNSGYIEYKNTYIKINISTGKIEESDINKKENKFSWECIIH